jgi:hypothetical protein
MPKVVRMFAGWYGQGTARRLAALALAVASMAFLGGPGLPVHAAVSRPRPTAGAGQVMSSAPTAAAASNPPQAVAAKFSARSATVRWNAPARDGGPPVTSYTITAAPDDKVVTVPATAREVTITGLAHAAADAFIVTAASRAGSSEGTAFAPAGVIADTVVSPDGRPVAHDRVSIYTSDPPAAGPATWTPSLIGTAMTSASGSWAFTFPPYSSLPADARAAADGNGGYLNVDVTAFGTAEAGHASYLEEADTTTFAWVGTRARTRPPATLNTPNVVAMTMRPGTRDEASLDTPAGEASTWAARHSVLDSAAAYATPPADAYGYQSIISPDPDPRYAPYIAADGTDLANVPVTAGVSGAEPDACKVFPLWVKHVARAKNTWAYTKIGEYHSNWDAQGSYNYTVGATTSVGAYLSVDGDHYSLDGSVEYDNSKAVENGVLSGPFSSYQLVLALKYQKVKWWWTPPGYPDTVICKTERFIRETGFYNPRHGFVYIKNGASVWKGWDGIQGWREHGKPQYWNVTSQALC